MTPAPLQVGQAPSELELNSAGFTPLALANALRIGSRARCTSPDCFAANQDRSLVDHHHAVAAGDRAVDERLLPEPATPVTTQSIPSGMSTSTSWRLCVDARARPACRRRPHRLLEGRAIVEVATGDRVALPQPARVPSKTTSPPARGRPGPRSTTWSAIAIISACAPRRARCSPCPAAAAAGRSSARCRAGATRSWLVEHVGHVGER